MYKNKLFMAIVYFAESLALSVLETRAVFDKFKNIKM